MIEITNLTKKTKPRLPWEKAKEKILGRKYILSVVLAENKLMKKLNNEYRGKDKTADTLSFPLSKNGGEIFLNINNKKSEIFFLFIHSLLHLKGFKHSKKMEKEENLYYNYLYET